MNSARAIEVLNRLRPRLEARGIVHAGVFGSVGRDRAGASSDVDVVVTPAEGRRLDLIDLGGVDKVDSQIGCPPLIPQQPERIGASVMQRTQACANDIAQD